MKLQELCALLGRFAAVHANAARSAAARLSRRHSASAHQPAGPSRWMAANRPGAKMIPGCTSIAFRRCRRRDGVFCAFSAISIRTAGLAFWRVGERFENVAPPFLAAAQPAELDGEHAHVSAARDPLGALALRSYMLQLHDRMKEDEDYQRHGEQVSHAFPPGSTWIVFTDQVPHAAMSGIHQLEQTFYVPVECLRTVQRRRCRCWSNWPRKSWHDPVPRLCPERAASTSPRGLRVAIPGTHGQARAAGERSTGRSLGLSM